MSKNFWFVCSHFDLFSVQAHCISFMWIGLDAGQTFIADPVEQILLIIYTEAKLM